MEAARYAQFAPLAPYSRSQHLTLSRTSQSSGRYSLRFYWPVQIVGMKLSCIAATAVGGLVAPTLDHLLLSLGTNETTLYTSTDREGDITSAESYADASALDLDGLCYHSIVLAGPGEIGLEARWKRFAAGVPIYEDALISVTARFRRISEATARALIAEHG